MKEDRYSSDLFDASNENVSEEVPQPEDDAEMGRERSWLWARVELVMAK